MIFNQKLLATILVTAFGVGCTDWCDITCDIQGVKVEHLRCKFKYVATPTGDCTEKKPAMAPADRKNILHKHNNLRNNVNLDLLGWDFQTGKPAWRNAGNMRQLVWDYELERTARIWSGQCRENETYNCIKNEDSDVWMNVVTFPMCSYSISVAFKEFTGAFEVRGNGSIDNAIDSFNPLRIHATLQPFTAIIWAETWLVGCHKSTYRHKGQYMNTVVCLYAPGGNVLNKPIFLKDSLPCNKCPSGTRCNPSSIYPNLCARESDPEVPKDIPDWISLAYSPIKPKVLDIILLSNCVVIARFG